MLWLNTWLIWGKLLLLTQRFVGNCSRIRYKLSHNSWQCSADILRKAGHRTDEIKTEWASLILTKHIYLIKLRSCVGAELACTETDLQFDWFAWLHGCLLWCNSSPLEKRIATDWIFVQNRFIALLFKGLHCTYMHELLGLDVCM